MIERVVTVIVAPIAVIFILFLVRKEVQMVEKNMEKEKFTVRKSRLNFYVGLLLIAADVFVLIMVMREQLWSALIIIFAIFLLSVYLIYIYFVERIYVDGSSITYYRKFSRKETIYFHKLSQATITSIGWGIERLSLYNGDKKIILVDSDSVGYSILMERLNEENIKGIGERIGSKSGEGH